MSDHKKNKLYDEKWNPMAQESLDKPFRWKKPRRIFLSSKSDLFYESVPFEFMTKVFDIMAHTPEHTYYILTKRPERMWWFVKQYDPENMAPYPLPNVWLGVSVENQSDADERIPLLLQTPAAVRFLSMEPLLGPVDIEIYLGDCEECGNFGSVAYALEEPGSSLCLDACPKKGAKPRVDWVIVGGESGPGARPMHPDWVRSIRDQCYTSGVSFFFKQWGDFAPTCENAEWFVSPDGMYGRWEDEDQIKDGFGVACMNRVGKIAAGRLLDGQEWNQMPEVRM